MVGPLEITGGDDAAQSSGWCFVRSGAAIDICLDGRSLKSREVMLALRHREPLRQETDSREGS